MRIYIDNMPPNFSQVYSTRFFPTLCASAQSSQSWLATIGICFSWSWAQCFAQLLPSLQHSILPKSLRFCPSPTVMTCNNWNLLQLKLGTMFCSSSPKSTAPNSSQVFALLFNPHNHHFWTWLSPAAASSPQVWHDAQVLPSLHTPTVPKSLPFFSFLTVTTCDLG